MFYSLVIFSSFAAFGSASDSFFSSSSLFKAPDEICIAWNVTASTPTRSKQILVNVVGTARKGKFHAIIGPSGSGKTTLLNILASNIPRKSLILEGKVRSLPSIEPVFVQQDDLLFSQLTVLETLDTSAALRLQFDNDTENARHSLVHKLILGLGLKKVTDTKVGDSKTRGISGGEKKRLCIGNECIGSSISSHRTFIKKEASTVIFADEPTSGLDSYQAQRVVELLKGLARTGCTVVSSIHQPRASVFAMFDDITLVAEGRCMYTGTTEGMSVHFKSLGYPCPFNINPAEHYVDLVSVDYSSPELEEISKKRIQELAQALYEKQQKSNQNVILSTKLQNINSARRLPSKKRFQIKKFNLKKINFKSLANNLKNSSKKFKILFHRAWRSITRDKALNIARLCSSLFSALLFGAIYFRMGNGASTVPDRLGNVLLFRHIYVMITKLNFIVD